MAAISETLRQARLRSGVDLERLAERTKINPRYLQAIETGDFGKLPSGIFARMFIKQYADAVGLDGASFAEEFQRSTSSGHDSGPDIQAIAATHSSYHPSVPGLSSVADRVRSDRIASMLSSFIWVVGAILVCAGAYYGLAHLPSHSTVTQGSTAPKPAVTQAPVHSGSAPAAAVPPSLSPASSSPSGQEANARNPGQAAPAANPATTPTVATPSAGTASPPSTAIQLVIAASESVWVSATADGKTVVSELMPAGSSKIVAATGYARITLGNAGGAVITFNGKKLEPIGLKGEVRSVEFTPQGPQVISRASPKAEPPPNPDPLR